MQHSFYTTVFHGVFAIATHKEPDNKIHPNLKSGKTYPAETQEKINKEMRKGRVAGPFSVVPFSKFVCSPIGIIPKSTPGKFRLIQHLSYPKNDSVNSNIPKEFSSVQYATTDDAIRMILSKGVGCFLYKTDIEDAFRLVPLHPHYYKYFVFHMDNQFFFDMCLPMGCSQSCHICNILRIGV